MYVVEQSTDISGRPVSYAYRPSAFGPLRTFTLSEDGIDWMAGIQSGHISYRNIRRLRISFRPTGMQPQRFVVELWGEGAPKLQIASSTWKSIAEQERLDQSYSVFVKELHARISNAAGAPRLLQRRRPLVSWPRPGGFLLVA